MSSKQAYLTLVFAEIVQESPLSTGGNRPHELVDSPLALDGKNRPVLRGSSLAGCFISSARALLGQLPNSITGEATSDSLTPSSWRFAHAHPARGNEPTNFYQHVSIDRRTQAAKDDALYNLEALPSGTRWPMCLEILPGLADNMALHEAYAAAVLQQWSQSGGIRLGKGGGHGYGWCHLENITILRLSKEHALLWPNAWGHQRSPSEWVEDLKKAGVPSTTVSDLLQKHASLLPAQAGPYSIQLSGDIIIGERKDSFGQGYGVDSLSLGGHARLDLNAQSLHPKVIPPRNIPFPLDKFKPDFTINIDSPAPGAQPVPVVPGASIRGVWRNLLERRAKAGYIEQALVDALFGSTEKAGCLSVAPATLVDDQWRLFWQQHVAIDELTGGVYGSNKFDRMAIADARFRWRACVSADTQEQAEVFANLLGDLIVQQGDGHLPLGGGVWRGHGHVRWTLDSTTAGGVA